MTTRKADDLEPIEVTTTGPRPGPNDQRGFSDEAAKTDDGAVRTLHKARLWAFGVVKSRLALWHGLCLRFVRECYNVDSLYPDAITAWLEADHKHRTDDPSDVPNGKPAFFAIGEHGHVVFGIGDGKCISTDVDASRPGAANVVKIEAICSAWGALFIGWTDDLNGEMVPAARARARLNDHAWRVRMLRRAIVRAGSAGQAARAKRLREWLTDVRRHRRVGA